ncbi:C13 family peptidase [Thermodesulfobacteriota bacterium]
MKTKRSSIITKAYLLVFRQLVALCLIFFPTLSHAELKIDSSYPTLGVMGQNLEVEINGTGFNENTRFSLYLDSGNQRYLVGSVDTPDAARSTYVFGSYAYVADRDNGLQVIDITDPSNPQIVGFVDTPGQANDVTIVGDTAYVADGDNGLQVIDISDPSNPQIVGSLDALGSTNKVCVSGIYAYVASSYDYSSGYGGGLQVIDINDSSNPNKIASVNTDNEARGVSVSGSYAYVAGFNNIQVIDISDPLNPKIIGSVFTVNYGRDVFVAGSYAYMAGWPNGLSVIDISVPSNPKLIGIVSTPGEASGVFVLGSYAYVADGDNGLQVIDISNPSIPKISGDVNTHDAIQVSVLENFAFVADRTNGLQVIDIIDPSNPQIIGSVETQHSAMGVFVSGNYAYVADASYGLKVIDIIDPSNPLIIGFLDTPGDDADKVFVSGNYAYITDVQEGLLVVDVSIPSSPEYLTTVDTPGYDHDVFVSGSYAYVANDTSGLQIIDISDPLNPQIIANADTLGNAQRVFVSGSYAYVANPFSGLQVIDISDPSNPEIVGSVDSFGYNLRSVFVSGKYAYLADIGRGIQMIDISNPSSPELVGSVVTYEPWSVVISGSYAYVANGPNGFAIAPLPVEITDITVNNDTSVTLNLPSPLIAGTYTLRAFNGIEQSELFGAVSFTDDPTTLNAKAIIVAGGGPLASGGTMWAETKINANKAYDALILQGFQHDSIYYISEETPNEYVDNSSPETFMDDLYNTITTWAANASQLLIYFVDHGGEDEFILYEDSETTTKLNARDLDEWLDTLQETMTGPVIFIYDACQSGSFISRLRPLDGKDRIVITGSSYEPSYFLEDGKGSFSYQFWDKTVFNRGNLGDAFSYSRDIMQSYQSALVEANWHLEGDNNENEDISIAEDMTIQRGGYSYIGVHPFVSSVSDPQVLTTETSAIIQASGIIDSDSVHALIIPPDVNPETSDIPITDLPTIELTDPDGDHTYEGVYDEFDTEGTYAIVVKSKTTHELYSYVNESNVIHNIYSSPLYTSITKTSGIVNSKPDDYEGDGNHNQAAVIIISDDEPQVHNFHSAGDEDWIKFYGIAGEIYKIKASNVSVFCDPIIELIGSDGITPLSDPINDTGEGEYETLEWACEEEGIYYVRITNANSNFGENVRYDLKVYLPVQGIPGTLTGMVINVLADGIDGAVITSDISSISAITNSIGTYEVKLSSGTHTISVDVPGYISQSKEGVVIESDGYIYKDFVLDADSDNDGTADDEDGCPDDPNKTVPGECGCGIADTDSDGDGIADCNDNYPYDYDNDGMSDEWEDQNGLNYQVDDADLDADGDGFSNIQEYNRGTDPQDAEDHPSKGLPWLMLLLGDE